MTKRMTKRQDLVEAANSIKDAAASHTQGPGMRKPGKAQAKAAYRESDFYAEAAYADSIFRTALGDREGTVSALRRALEWKPTYAPAILSMGSVEYQLGRRAAGRRLFHSLLSLPKTTPDLCEIIDEAGSFLIQTGAHKDGLALYRAAMKRFPAVAALHQGLACCAGHVGLHDEAVEASERALQLEPDSQKLVNDLGWSLLEAGRLGPAEKMLERAVSMDPSDALARENLRICKAKIKAKVRAKIRGVAADRQERAAAARQRRPTKLNQ